MHTVILVGAVLIAVVGLAWAMIALLNATLRRDALLAASPLLGVEDIGYLGGVAATAGAGGAACGASSASSCS